MRKCPSSLLAGVLITAGLFYMSKKSSDIQSKSNQRDNVQLSPVRKKSNLKDSNCIDHTFQSVYSYDTRWKVNQSVCYGCYNSVKTRLKTRYGDTPIHVYNLQEDVYISHELTKFGSIETGKINNVINHFTSDPTLNFIDVGANLGVFSLNVAKLGRRVLAVEALNKNVQHACLSIRDGGLQNNIKILHNALSDRSGMVVNLGVDVKNMGGTFVDFESDNIKKTKRQYGLIIGGTYGSVLTITLDNILELEEIKDFKNVIMKIDIEGYEYKALLGAEKFFDSVNVKAVLMEWVFHKQKSSGNGIAEFMRKRMYKPYSEDGVKQLDILKPETWGDYNVWWLK